MLFDKPIKLRAIRLPIFLLLLPTFSSIHSIGFCLWPLLVCCFANSGVLSTNSWCLDISKMFERWRCQTGAHYPDELGDIFVFDTGTCLSFHPLAEVVGYNKQKLLLCCSNGQGADYVHPPLHKQPRTYDRVEGFRRYTENGSVSLTSIASSDIAFSVLLHGGLIVSLRVGLVSQSSFFWVIATYALMEFG